MPTARGAGLGAVTRALGAVVRRSLIGVAPRDAFMSGANEQSHSRIGAAKATVLRWLLFFLLFLLVIWLWIDPNLIYYAHGWMLQYTIYIPGTPIPEDVPYVPGAASQWAAGYMSHFYFYSAYAAAIVTGVVWLVCFGADRYIVALGGGRWLRWLAFVPALAILFQYGRYSHFLGANVALAAGMLLLYVYTRLPTKQSVLSFVLFVVFTAAVYLGAVEAALAFVVLGLAFEFLVRRRWIVALAGLLVVAAVPWAASALLMNFAPGKAYAALLPAWPVRDPTMDLPVLSLLLILPMAGLDWVARRALSGLRRPASSEDAAADPSPRRAMTAAWWVATVTLLLALGGGTWLASDPVIRRFTRFNRFMRMRMFDMALAEATEIPRPYFTPIISFDVTRALFHQQGTLVYDMFSFPQSIDGILLGDERGFVFNAYRRAELLLEMGHVNASEHLSHEMLEYMSYNPWALRRLATINMAKDLPDAASVFLQELAKDSIPIHREWARRYLARIQSGSDLSDDPDVQYLKSVMPLKDGGYTAGRATSLAELVTYLLAANNGNRMAFEYGMASSLAMGDFGAAVRGVSFLDRLDYPAGQIPRHCEEAILLHMALSGATPDLGDRRISDMARARFSRFTLEIAKSGSAQRAAEALRSAFGDTYYYYVAFSLGKYHAMVSRLTQ